MKKNEMIKAVATKAEMTQKEVAAVIDALDATIKEAMVARDTVKVLDVTFKTEDKKAKDGVSKLGGKEQPWHTDPYVAVTVTAAKNLKKMLA